MRKRSAIALLGLAATFVAAPAQAHQRDTEFKRLSTFPAYLNSSIDDTAAAEISTVTEDGRTVVYSDSPGKRLGFVDITNPGQPKPAGTLALDGEPTSVAHLGRLLLAGVNTSASKVDPSGKLVVIDDRSRKIVRTIDLGGQPDSVAVAPSGRYIAVAIENERDEDVNDGAIPQLPAGYLSVIDTKTWKASKVELTGLAAVAPTDPEPEYVSVNSRDEAIVSLQENNHFAIVSLASKKVVKSFSAGEVTVSGVDTKDDDNITLDGTITARREPDGVTWINDYMFASANEGDWVGGTRGWTIFSRDGQVIWDAGNSLEHIAVEHGQYPDKRSDAKGIEVENVAFAKIGRTPYVFVNSERGNFTAVYDVSNPWKPKFEQLMPTVNSPEGVVAVPSRGLVVVSSEEENPDANIRGAIQIFGVGSPNKGNEIVSDNLIPFGTLSALSAVPGTRNQLVSVTDSAYTPTRILTIDTQSRPAKIYKQLTVTKDGKPVGYDAEGIVARKAGGYWLASEGSATTPNLLVRLDDKGRTQQEIPLPADIAAAVTTNGFEGVSEVGNSLWVAVQRPLKTDPVSQTRIGRYDLKTGTWSWLLYPLDTAPIGWTGLSEIVAVDGNTFAVIERDNQRGPQASIKKIYKFDVPATWTGTPTVKKKLVKDLLPLLKADHGWVQDKVEGLAIAGDGQTYAVTDNDALDDATGETVFLRLGRLF
ncbi:esterase-like activity of phytase family protein [Actinoplanes bogorensis]|uniref:Esterase-like activity of phytase family protein n=1 Tax=Paractinoplanes bogorensis TaxID=1610840 RepID=A0ABS5Z4V3_9ACTN|nr:esterase-like activity of phytase family protein [Actinoplanes bogorensis]MBU2670652.1 esterase-like activity of phytase family protein [Actinoplanes bogorensis]